MPNPYLAVAAVVLGVAHMQVAGGLMGTFVPLGLARDGASNQAIALVAAVYSLGFLVGCLVAPHVIRAVGHIRTFAVFAAALSVVTLAFALGVDPALWGLLRLVSGLCAAVQFSVAESWLNDRTPNAMRGRVYAAYAVCGKVALVTGPLLLTLEGDSVLYVMLGSAFYSLALIPVAMTRAEHPAVPKVATLHLGTLYRTAPAAMIGCVVAGLVNAAVIGLSPAYAVQVGLETATVGWLVAAMQLGSLVLQWPFGLLSDRIDRRLVMAIVAGGAAGASLLAALVGGHPAVLLLALTLWGGFALSLYAISVAHANDHALPHQMVGLSSSLLLTWSVGSIVGPFLAAQVMAWVGPAGLYLYSAVVMLGFAVFVLWRRTRRAAMPAADREPFVAVPQASSPVAARLDPRAPADDRAPSRDAEERALDYAI